MDFMSTAEAADYLKVTKFTILRLIKRGAIRAQKFGSAWMVDRPSLEEYQKRNEGKSPRDPTRG